MSSHHDVIKKVSDQLESWDYDLDRLQHRLEDAEGELRQKLNQTVQEIKLKKDGLKARVSELEKAAEDSAEEIAEGVEIAWTILQASFSDAKDNFMSEL